MLWCGAGGTFETGVRAPVLSVALLSLAELIQHSHSKHTCSLYSQSLFNNLSRALSLSLSLARARSLSRWIAAPGVTQDQFAQEFT